MSCTVFAVPSPLALSPVVNACTSTVAAPPLRGGEAIDFAVLTRGALPPMQRPACHWRDTSDASDRLRNSAHHLPPFDDDRKVRRQRHSVYMEMGIHERKTRDDAKKEKTRDAQHGAPRRPRPSSVMLFSGLLAKSGADTPAATATTTPATTAPGHKRKRLSWSLGKLAQEPTASPTPDPKRAATITTSQTLSSLASESTATSTASPATGSHGRRRSWYAKLSDGGRRLRTKSTASFMELGDV